MFSLVEMKTANPNANLSIADYVAYAIADVDIHADLFGALLSLLNPTLDTVGDELLVCEVGGPGRFRELLVQQLEPEQAAYWANMLELTSISGSKPEVETARRFAATLVSAWNRVLSSRYPHSHYRAKEVSSADEDEVLITMSRYWPGVD